MLSEFPEITVRASGASGIELCAKMPEKFFCGEFTLRDDRPIPVFISPWMQFEPARMNEYRQSIAHELTRRVLAYDNLIKQVEDLQNILERERTVMDRRYETQETTYRMWREDRAKFGLPEDFSDIKDWPPEMMSGYDSIRN